MPRSTLGGPEAVLEYLGRYTHRVAISNERIVGIDEGHVGFGCGPIRPRASGGRSGFPGLSSSAASPAACAADGFKRIRHYGLLSPARKRDGLAAARRRWLSPPLPAVIESVAAFLLRVDRLASMRCSHCGGTLRVVGPLPPARYAPPGRGPP